METKKVAPSFSFFLSFFPFFARWVFDTGRQKYIRERSPKLIAQTRGLFVLLEVLNLAKMGDKMKGRVIQERERLKRVKATAANFLSANDCFNEKSKGYAMMGLLTESILTCLKQRTPLSEDLLFIVWKWSAKVEKGGTSESNLWKTLKETLEKTLVIPLVKRHWEWFKMNVLYSAVETPSLPLPLSPFAPRTNPKQSSGMKNTTRKTKSIAFAETN